MSVAENPTPAATPEPISHEPNVQFQFAITSAIGAFALLAGLAMIFSVLPTVWWIGWNSLWAENTDLQKNVFLSDALLILLDLIAIGGLCYGAYVGLQTQTQPGVRAGMVVMAIFAFASLCLVAWLSDLIAREFTDPPVGWTLLVIILAALLGGTGYLFAKVPGWMSLLESIESQGWFHAVAYKGNQGVRVRRGTIVGALAVGAAAIYTMVTHRYFGAERPDGQGNIILNDWYWIVPYTNQDKIIPLMYKVHLLMPIVICVLMFWVAWRIVNIPGFADFLIATEAEMNKVSWTNRRRLFQDTIVVLVTVFLFTTFLFVVDIIWIKVLSAPGIQVLIVDLRQEQQKQQEKAQW